MRTNGLLTNLIALQRFGCYTYCKHRIYTGGTYSLTRA